MTDIVERLRSTYWKDHLANVSSADAADEIEQLRARLTEAEVDAAYAQRLSIENELLRRDAERYRWLRERINFRDQFVRSEDGRGISTKWRAWVHDDYRENPPASEHIDEYIDAFLAGERT